MRPARPLPFALCCLLAWLAAAPAAAGAWLRDEGSGFSSWTAKVQHGADTKGYGTYYLEYGATPDLTVGLDLGGDETGDYKALAFVLMPISRDSLHVAFQLAVGVLEDDPAFRPGLSFGRGFSIGGLSGWTNVDLRAAVGPGDVDLAIDATLGVNMWEGTKTIWQVQHGGQVHRPDFLRLEAAVVWQVAPKIDLEAGLTTGLEDSEDFGVKFGFWRRF